MRHIDSKRSSETQISEFSDDLVFICNLSLSRLVGEGLYGWHEFDLTYPPKKATPILTFPR